MDMKTQGPDHRELVPEGNILFRCVIYLKTLVLEFAK